MIQGIAPEKEPYEGFSHLDRFKAIAVVAGC